MTKPQPKSKKITFRLTADQADKAGKVAGRMRKQMSEWLRDLVLKEIGRAA